MAWSDKPFYEMNKVKFEAMEFQKYIPAQNAPTPSPIFCWCMQEEKKREAGLENEIDINLIKGALMGVKNRWLPLVKKHPEKFEMKNKRFDWEQIKKLT